MEILPLQRKLINKVIAMSADQLSWLENILSNIPSSEIESEEDLVSGIMALQDDGGAFDFLYDEPDHYSAINCQFLYDSTLDQLIKNETFKRADQ